MCPPSVWPFPFSCACIFCWVINVVVFSFQCWEQLSYLFIRERRFSKFLFKKIGHPCLTILTLDYRNLTIKFRMFNQFCEPRLICVFVKCFLLIKHFGLLSRISTWIRYLINLILLIEVQMNGLLLLPVYLAGNTQSFRYLSVTKEALLSGTK